MTKEIHYIENQYRLYRRLKRNGAITDKRERVFSDQFELYSQHKRIYEFDAVMSHVLIKSKTSKIPTNLIKLPVNGAALSFDLNGEHFAFGRKIYGVDVIAGEVGDFMRFLVHVHSNDDWDGCRRFGFDFVRSQEFLSDDLTNHVATLDHGVFWVALLITNALLYICGDKETQKSHWPNANCPINGSERHNYDLRAPTVVRVGERFSRYMRNHISQASTLAVTPDGTPKKTIAPHIRGGHFHLFWTGPKTGPRIPKIHFISPIAVLGGPKDRPFYPTTIAVRG